MNKLLYAAVGATLTLVSASPAFAQTVDSDLVTAVENRVAIDRSLAETSQQTASASVEAADEAVLGISALPSIGFDAPLQIKLDLLAALRADVAKIRDMAALPVGPSAD